MDQLSDIKRFRCEHLWNARRFFVGFGQNVENFGEKFRQRVHQTLAFGFRVVLV